MTNTELTDDARPWFDVEFHLQRIEAELAANPSPTIQSELTVLRQGIKIFQPAGRERQFSRMLIAALIIGEQIGISNREPILNDELRMTNPTDPVLHS